MGKVSGFEKMLVTSVWCRGRTEDEFFRWRKHVDGEGHFILVDLQSDPANERTEDPEDGHFGLKELNGESERTFGCAGESLFRLGRQRK